MNPYKITIPKQILILTALAVFLNVARILWSGSFYFFYLIWNIFLAYLPFFVSSLLLYVRSRNKNYTIVYIVGWIIWLFLFPNAPYLVTDMIHLTRFSIVPMWFDALLLFSSAWVGILLAMYSLNHIEKILLSRYSKKITSLCIAILILLSSLGIYIGRFLRWNSWDILIRPGHILKDLWTIFSSPAIHTEAYAFTGFFFIFILASYWSWKMV